jgi:hypothetical protein
MAIDSVSLAANAVQQQVPARQLQPQPQPQASPPPPERSREGEGGTVLRESQPTAVQAAAQQTSTQQAERPEQPKPVVNAQGQKTGTIINTSA